MITVQLTEGICTLSGAMFDYNNPGATEIDLHDLVIPLSNNCRFAGHLQDHYSIAQHSVNVSYLVPAGFEFDALMHDTSEAFTNDITTPLKIAMPLFKDLEVSIETAMAYQFGFDFPLHPCVKIADLQMLKIEKEELKHDFSDWAVLEGITVTPEERARVDISVMTPRQARELFLERYYELAA